jgi:Raf kinase inhibitor-like YbhB/YbcL family protein
MPTRRGLLGVAATLALAGCFGRDGNGEGNGNGSAGSSVNSPAFEVGESIPERYTCDGADVSPPLRIRRTPDGAETLAIVVDDPDAPTGTPFVHWLLWNLPPGTEEVPEGVPRDPTVSSLGGAVQGTNDFGELGYRGPCPPTDDGAHTYQFTVSLVDTTLDLDPGADSQTFRSAVESHVRGETTITASYER